MSNTLEPDNNNFFDKETANTKKKLSLTKQFAIRQYLEDVEKMSPEQLLSFAKYMIVYKAYTEQTYNAVLSMGTSMNSNLNNEI